MPLKHTEFKALIDVPMAKIEGYISTEEDALSGIARDAVINVQESGAKVVVSRTYKIGLKDFQISVTYSVNEDRKIEVRVESSAACKTPAYVCDEGEPKAVRAQIRQHFAAMS